MKFTIVLFFLFVVNFLSFSQTNDFDFDKIENKLDPNPYVSDVPKLNLVMGNISFGLKYLISGTNTTSSIKSLTIERENSNSYTNTTKYVTSSEMIDKASGDIKGSYGFGDKGSSSLGSSISFSSEFTNTFKYSNDITSETISKYLNKSKDFYEENSSTEIKFDAYSGYMSSSIFIKNLGRDVVSINNLTIKVIEYNPFTKKEEKVLRVINLGNHEIDPTDENITSYGIPIAIDSILTNDILTITKKGNILKPDIQSYRVIYKNIEYVPSILNKDLKENTIKINIVDQFNNHNEYNVAHQLESNKSITLKKALEFITKKKAEVISLKIDDKIVYALSEFNGKKSDFQVWDDPLKYKESDLKQTAWVIVIHENNLNNDINLLEELPLNSEFSIINMSKKSVWEKFRKIDEFPFQVGVSDLKTNIDLWNSEFPPLVVGGKSPIEIVNDFIIKNKSENGEIVYSNPSFAIKSSDIITFEFLTSIADIQSKERDFSYQPTCPNGVCFGDFSLRFGTIKSLYVNNIIIGEQNELINKIYLQFSDNGKQFSIEELQSFTNVIATIKPDGKLIISFSLPKDLFINEILNIKLIFKPFLKPLSFGFSVNTQKSGFIIPYNNETIFLPRWYDCKLSISHEPVINQ